MNSIVSYPDRGVGGKSNYRGNCSPRLIEDVITQFHPDEISDYMVGSGTTEDVAKMKGLENHCYDLNRGFDLLNDDIQERSNLIFWHPPYWDIIKYAGSQYDAKAILEKYGIDPLKEDLSKAQSWEQFVKEMNYCMIKQFASLEKGGRMAVLVGDIKKQGKLYSMILELAKPGTIENIVIKAQYNCLSYGKQYTGKFIPIVHEYMLIVKKNNPLLYDIQYTKTYSCDTRDMKIPTWRDVVIAVLEDKAKSMSLSEIYASIDGHKKANKNPNWQAKVRQTLELGEGAYFTHDSRGVWSLAA